METRSGVKGTVHGEIFFTEESVPSATVLRHLRVTIPRQNADLDQVKDLLAQKARNAGATAVMNFRYGQKRNAWWRLFITTTWDTEGWYGEGDAVKLE